MFSTHKFEAELASGYGEFKKISWFQASDWTLRQMLISHWSDWILVCALFQNQARIGLKLFVGLNYFLGYKLLIRGKF